MKKILLFVTLMLSFVPTIAQKNLIWQEVGQEQVSKLVKSRTDLSLIGEKYFKVNVSSIKQILTLATNKFSNSAGVQVMFPTQNGEFEIFEVWENSNFHPTLQAQNPDIRSYVGRGVSDKNASINFSVSPFGIQTMLLRGNRDVEFIEAYDKEATTYVLFSSSNRKNYKLPFNCSTADIDLHDKLSGNNQVNKSTNKSSDATYREMRLALSCTAEYTTYYGGVTQALAGMNATMTRVNGIMEKDIALHLNIIPNNTVLIFTNAATDPYDDAAAGSQGTWNAQLQTTITNLIGEANYDIGHLFGASGGGGNAGCIGCVCLNGKGSAFTSPSNNAPVGDTFDVDYVIHEMGHQLGANHTFTHVAQGNNPGTVFSTSQLEPGSGSTIMAYAGITGPTTNIQQNSNALYSYRSITQIQNNLATKTCPVVIPNSNSTPTSNAGIDWTIPKTTPFILTGVGTDANPNDVLSYIWEENDVVTGTFATPAAASATTFVSATKTIGPNFRTFVPTSSPSRYLPKLSSVLAGQYTTPSNWECLNTNGRTMKFVMTVRDNNVFGQTQSDEMIVTVSNTRGPFVVTSQNTTGLSWVQGATETVTWNVANTNLLVGSSNVDITLSTDGGLTFPTILAANVLNNGSATVTVPNVQASNCRILVKPTGNIYYNVNSTPFAIGLVCNVVNNSPALAIPDGAAANTTGGIVTDVINVPTVGVVNNMKVKFSSNHTWIGDLRIRVIHPDNTSVSLWNRTCNSPLPQASNMNVTFQDGSPAIACGSTTVATVGTFAPVTSLAVLNGKPTAGNWTISAEDMFNGDTGDIQSWGVDFGCTSSLANENFNIDDAFSVFPNPNQGSFNVRYNSSSGNEISIDVHDLRGRSIYSNKYQNDGLFYQNIILRNIQSGMYMVTVKDGEKQGVKKIIVE